MAGNRGHACARKSVKGDVVDQAIFSKGNWLCIKKMRPINEDMLYQYDRPLEWWYECRARNEDYFSGDLRAEALRNSFGKALYRICHFDTNLEGDTCRTRFVHRMRKILDERPFIKEFKDMWGKVKSGDVRFDNAFDHWPE